MSSHRYTIKFDNKDKEDLINVLIAGTVIEGSILTNALHDTCWKVLEVAHEIHSLNVILIVEVIDHATLFRN